MFRRLLSSLALLAVTGSLAAAQTTFSVATGGKLNGHYNMNDLKGQLGGTGIPAGLASSPFQVWCVDKEHTINPGTSYNAVVTQLNSGDLSATLAQDKMKYLKAAWLTGQFGSAAAGSANDQNPQWAIWAVIHGQTCVNPPHGDYPAHCDGTVVGNLVAAADVEGGNMNAAEWFVITSRTGNNGLAQEMIARCQLDNGCGEPDIPNENPTPEPATMTLLAMGLAGMSMSSLRRRRRS